MATEQIVERFVINRVETKEVFDSMVEQGLVNPNELYLIASDEGIDGVTFTPNVAADGTLSWTNNGGLSNPASVNIKGAKGDTGAPGTNGVSATHSWNGTTLSVTSASGTSSANLKGEKGDKGDKGDTGANGTNGKDGTSVTVSSVTESTASGGTNVVTFSDGKKVNIKNGINGTNGTNGKDGVDGKTPVKGTDYYTEADKTEMVSRVLSALPTWTGGSY